MRSRFGEPLDLSTIAKTAIISPYHFVRVFEEITGTSPGRFLAAIRIQKAKELLVRTNFSVTSICFEVGYNSLGTFIRIFTELVGLSPNRFRNFATNGDNSSEIFGQHLSSAGIAAPKAFTSAFLTGKVSGPRSFAGLIFIGLFGTRIPQGRPAAGTLVSRIGSYKINDVPDGSYYRLAAAFPASLNALDYLLPQESTLLVASEAIPTTFVGGQAKQGATLALRRYLSTDPPIVIALPLLLIDQLNAPRDANKAP